MLQAAKVYLLVLVLIARSLGLMAQKPPTGGPNICKGCDPPIPLGIIIAASGLALGGASLYTFKLRGPKILVSDYLPAYLLRHNILPTPDAVDLMRQLNPKLNRTDVIRTKKNLVNPDFPEIPQEQLTSSINNVQTTTLPTELKQQVSLYKSSLKTFRNVKKSIKKSNISLDTVYSMLTKIDQIITPHEKSKEEVSLIKAQLVKDLFTVLNKTLSRNIATKIVGDTDSKLMKEILESLTELLLPDLNKRINPPKNSQFYYKDSSINDDKLYAVGDSTALNPSDLNLQSDVLSNTVNNLNNIRGGTNSYYPLIANMSQRFAFAIYKKSASGAIITKGPEVEGQYYVSYALPALRSYPESYHDCSPGLATYAFASLPPAKYYFVVKDSKGKIVALQRHLIDTKDAFMNSQIESEKKVIIVPIFVTQ